MERFGLQHRHPNSQVPDPTCAFLPVAAAAVAEVLPAWLAVPLLASLPEHSSRLAEQDQRRKKDLFFSSSLVATNEIFLQH